MIAPLRCSLLLLAASAAGLAAQQTRIDSSTAEIEVGRPWHASRLLQRTYPDGAGLDARGRLVLARAEEGARRWPEARRLLEGAAWLDELEGGEGRLILGRALEAEGRWADAAEAYRRYLALPAASGADGTPAVLARLVRAQAMSAGGDAAATLASLHAHGAALAGWSALVAGRAAAQRGDVQQVRALLAFVDDPEVRERSWDLEPRALLASGDSAAAEEALFETVGRLAPGSRRGEAWALLGEVRRARAAAVAAGEAFRQALAEGASTAPAGRAARGLLELGGLDAATALQVARALQQAGDAERALRAYDLHASLLSGAAPPAVGLARARLMAQVTARHDEAVELLRALSTEAEVGAAALDEWARLRDRQGRAADVSTLRDRLVERFPTSPEAANVVFLRGDAAHDRADFDAALRDYRRVVDAAPEQDRAGLSRMRWGQIHLHRGQTREAAEVFEGYLADFPTGRRWEEATYWAARTRMQLGEEARARELLADLTAREPFGYYAVLAGDLVGVPFRIDVPEGDTPPFPVWVRDGLRDLELLEAAGLEEGAGWMVARLRARAREAPTPEGLRLSHELTARGHSLDGINLAWELRERGEPWSRRLLEAVYPFPERERIEREAREWDVDPLLVAALIRQESAWEEAIRSPVGATGLMQIMPETGRQLFRQHGAGAFSPEMLAVGDLNLHLGTAYLVELLTRYDGALPFALSGYNAGPHRADRWKTFPEAADPLRLIERIPFAETRDYVKRIHRNRAIYQALYGDGPRTR
jgi:soluble lytic murein transglycosylase